MFPDYMNDMLRHARCGHCNAPQTTTDIQIVGVRRPEEFEAFYGEPVFIMVMGCKTCDQVTNYTMRRPRVESVEGCVSFIKLIEAECEGKSPPLNIPGLGKKGMPEPTALPNARQRAADAINNSRPRPSRRENQPNTPPTQREIQAFLHRLRKTSFRRKSKGFTDWMKDMGADPDTAGDADVNKQ